MIKKLYCILQPVWHYIKCVMVMKTEISNKQKRKFYSFGSKSVINKPYRQLCGLDKVAIGDKTIILDGARIAVFGDKGSQPYIYIGDRCYFSYGITLLATSQASIHIGNDVLFASNVIITNENHGMNPETEIPYMEQELQGKDVEIGDGCWIGEKTCILPGVSIGNKCIIGAGSVVTHSIPDYSIAAGNPARIIKKYNFESHQWERV